jgi:uncharacterized membrane protein YfhO
MRTNARTLDMLLLAGIVVATLITGVIHYTFGGMMFLLNSFGYVTAAVVVIASLFVLQRLRVLVLIGLAGYTIVTIVGWVVMGSRFDLAYFTKAVELVLLALIGVYLARHRDEIVPALRYLRALVLRRSEDAPAARSADK